MKRQPFSLEDKVRARIELHGGRATSSQVLPYVGASAAEVKELTGIVVTVERSGKSGRPATVFTLRGDASEDAVSTETAAQPMPAAPQREQNRATVVRLDTYRPEPKQTSMPAPAPKRPEPNLDANPFRALL
ncbi:hypothetical protein AB0J38_20395 [Streptomyces sp. NPDC050095]|uniref:hypothetical protein n=1 Tax=unclassified Streptomyces TaxID=2593676 RepID=UPI00343F9F23